MPSWILDLADLWLHAPNGDEKKGAGRSLALLIFALAVGVFVFKLVS